MKCYVAGFLYQPMGKMGEREWHVALVNKNKPEWQAGLWNGIGGKIEEGETPEEAMRREFSEETGMRLSAMPEGFWRLAVILTCPGGTVFFFAARSDMVKLPEANDNGETLAWKPADKLPDNVITNLRWLVPFCLYQDYRYPAMIYEKSGN